MLSLTKRAEYGLIAITHLARLEPDAVVSARDLADQHRVKLPLLMNVLKKLNQGNILRSIRGSKGGYQLAVDPGSMSLLSVLEVVEGPLRLISCVDTEADGSDAVCERDGDCVIQGPLKRVHDRLQTFLAETSIADIVANDRDSFKGDSDGRLRILA